MRRLPQLSVLVPQACTNVDSKETVEYVGTINKSMKQQQQQRQPAVTAVPEAAPALAVAARTLPPAACAQVDPAPAALQTVTPPALPRQRAAQQQPRWEGREPAAQCIPSGAAPLCSTADSWSSSSRPTTTATASSASSDNSAASSTSEWRWQQPEQAQRRQQHSGGSLRRQCRMLFSTAEPGEQQGGWLLLGHKPLSPEVQDCCWEGWEGESDDMQLTGASEQLLWGMAAPAAGQERPTPGHAATVVRELLAAAMEQLRQLRRLVVGERSTEDARKRATPRLTYASPISVLSRRMLRRAPTYQSLESWA